MDLSFANVSLEMDILQYYINEKKYHNKLSMKQKIIVFKFMIITPKTPDESTLFSLFSIIKPKQMVYKIFLCKKLHQQIFGFKDSCDMFKTLFYKFMVYLSKTSKFVGSGLHKISLPILDLLYHASFGHDIYCPILNHIIKLPNAQILIKNIHHQQIYDSLTNNLNLRPFKSRVV